MTKVQVSLPEPLKQFIDGLVAEGTFTDLSDYLQTLIDRDRRARQKDSVEALLIEGLNSGPATPMTPEDWDEMEREESASSRLAKAHKSR